MHPTTRKADHPILPLILHRCSPRAMTGEKISDAELMSLFESARWAPSCYNSQPWRFIYAKRETLHWEKLFNLLVDFNKSWCEKAAVLGVIVSMKVFEKSGNFSVTHALDTGAAWENLALEGNSRNLVVHGMAGFDYKKAKIDLQIPDLFEVLAMFAVGKRAAKETLSEELQAKESPTGRKALSEFVFEGIFK
jgi:nitroreductase